MNAEQLATFQKLPAEQTGPSIRAALETIASARASAASRAEEARTEMSERAAAFTLDSTKRRKLADIVADQDQDIAMLDALAARITEPLAEIEEAERRVELGEERVGLMDEMQALNEVWAKEYAEHASALAKLVATRVEFFQRAQNHAFAHGWPVPGIEKFEQLTDEGRLPLTAEQREEERWAAHQANIAADEVRRASNAARRESIALAPPPTPTITVGGVAQNAGHIDFQGPVYSRTNQGASP